MSMVTLTINGQQVEAPSGTTILQAARNAGIYIPTLCYHPDLPPAKGIEAAKAHRMTKKEASREKSAVYGEAKIRKMNNGDIQAPVLAVCLVQE